MTLGGTRSTSKLAEEQRGHQAAEQRQDFARLLRRHGEGSLRGQLGVPAKRATLIAAAQNDAGLNVLSGRADRAGAGQSR
jgi:hypothetical protein